MANSGFEFQPLLYGPQVLSRIYGPSAIYADVVDPNTHTGWMIITPERANKWAELTLANPTLTRIFPKDTENHFNPDAGLPPVLAAHKELRLGYQAIDNVAGLFHLSRFAGFESLEVTGLIRPEDIVNLYAYLTGYHEHVHTGNVELSVKGKVRTKINGYRLIEAARDSIGLLQRDQLIEFAGQSAVMEKLAADPDSYPLLTGMGRTKFANVDLRPGIALKAIQEGEVKTKGKHFSVTSRVEAEGGAFVARMEDMQGVMVSKRALLRHLRG